jgi:hypothetical protein
MNLMGGMSFIYYIYGYLDYEYSEAAYELPEDSA